MMKLIIRVLLIASAAALTACVQPGSTSQTVNPPQAIDVARAKALLLEDMVVIPAGQYTMGDINGIGVNDELPVHSVAIDSFVVSRYEVTFEQYDLFARATGRLLPDDQFWGRGPRPVINVSWEDAVAFTQWASLITGKPFRLLTEAEWEYVARAGSNNNYSFGNDAGLLCDYGNIADRRSSPKWRTLDCDDGFATTAPVGQFKANAFGVYDMHGNVWEWLEDCWIKSYQNGPATGAARVVSGCKSRVQRGGSWFYGTEEARSSYRSFGRARDNSVTVGFRVAHDL